MFTLGVVHWLSYSLSQKCHVRLSCKGQIAKLGIGEENNLANMKIGDKAGRLFSMATDTP